MTITPYLPRIGYIATAALNLTHYSAIFISSMPGINAAAGVFYGLTFDFLQLMFTRLFFKSVYSYNEALKATEIIHGLEGLGAEKKASRIKRGVLLQGLVVAGITCIAYQYQTMYFVQGGKDVGTWLFSLPMTGFIPLLVWAEFELAPPLTRGVTEADQTPGQGCQPKDQGGDQGAEPPQVSSKIKVYICPYCEAHEGKTVYKIFGHYRACPDYVPGKKLKPIKKDR